MGLRVSKAKDGELKAQWGKLPRDIPDMVFSRGVGVPKCDGHLLYGVLCGKQMRLAVGDEKRTAYYGHVFDKSFMDELTERGYDITTLKFSGIIYLTPTAESAAYE